MVQPLNSSIPRLEPGWWWLMTLDFAWHTAVLCRDRSVPRLFWTLQEPGGGSRRFHQGHRKQPSENFQNSPQIFVTFLNKHAKNDWININYIKSRNYPSKIQSHPMNPIGGTSTSMFFENQAVTNYLWLKMIELYDQTNFIKNRVDRVSQTFWVLYSSLAHHFRYLRLIWTSPNPAPFPTTHLRRSGSRCHEASEINGRIPELSRKPAELMQTSKYIESIHRIP